MRLSFCGDHRNILEKPADLRREDPEIYHLLVDFYQFDPIVWH